jgi:hypothetical protein
LQFSELGLAGQGRQRSAVQSASADGRQAVIPQAGYQFLDSAGKPQFLLRQIQGRGPQFDDANDKSNDQTCAENKYSEHTGENCFAVATQSGQKTWDLIKSAPVHTKLLSERW